MSMPLSRSTWTDLCGTAEIKIPQIQMQDAVLAYLIVVIVLSFTAFLPDPYAFDHHGNWEVFGHNATQRSTRHIHNLMRFRSFATHAITLSFVLFFITEFIWVKANSKSFEASYEWIIIVSSLVASVVIVIRLRYASGVIVGLALTWLVGTRMGIDYNKAIALVTSGAVGILATILVCVLVGQYIGEHVVAYFQFPFVSSFGLSIGPAVVAHHGVRHYTTRRAIDHELWPAVVAVFVGVLVYSVLQWAYAHATLCGKMSLHEHYQRAPARRPPRRRHKRSWYESNATNLSDDEAQTAETSDGENDDDGAVHRH